MRKVPLLILYASQTGNAQVSLAGVRFAQIATAHVVLTCALLAIEGCRGANI